MNDEAIKKALESVLFIAGDAVEISDAAAALEIGEQELGRIIDDLMLQKEESGAGVLLKRVGNKIQLCSNPAYMPYIDKTLQPVKKTKLSQSLLETLSIIAYKQPITRFEIEQIRGVRCNYSIAILIERGLIDRAGKKKTLGNPMLYTTTDEFLRHFGIASLKELPELTQG
ncbi:MAG: SMC-Scp complex subunit ScpB [Eubacteriales bacterium]|nr:SMC-Scp complex subunit ScpB [Eubacteriales bacterium]